MLTSSWGRERALGSSSASTERMVPHVQCLLRVVVEKIMLFLKNKNLKIKLFEQSMAFIFLRLKND